MKRRKALLSEEQLLAGVRGKVRKVRASETREQTLHRQEQNRTDKHKHLPSSLIAPRVLHFSDVRKNQYHCMCAAI